MPNTMGGWVRELPLGKKIKDSDLGKSKTEENFIKKRRKRP